MTTIGFVEAKNDRLCFALGREMVVFRSFDAVKDDVATAFERERVRYFVRRRELGARKATNVRRLIEEPAGDGHVALGEGTAMREDCRIRRASVDVAIELYESALTGERECMEALVLMSVGHSRRAQQRQAKHVPFASIAVYARANRCQPYVSKRVLSTRLTFAIVEERNTVAPLGQICVLVADDLKFGAVPRGVPRRRTLAEAKLVLVRGKFGRDAERNFPLEESGTGSTRELITRHRQQPIQLTDASRTT